MDWREAHTKNVVTFIEKWGGTPESLETYHQFIGELAALTEVEKLQVITFWVHCLFLRTSFPSFNQN